jgi:hypothetical protein
MTAPLAEPWIVDVILAFVVIEGLLLIVWRARIGAGPPVAGTLANLSSGAALLLALRAALSDASSMSVMACLSAALIAHVADLASRWEAPRQRPLPNLLARMIFRNSSTPL